MWGVETRAPFIHSLVFTEYLLNIKVVKNVNCCEIWTDVTDGYTKFQFMWLMLFQTTIRDKILHKYLHNLDMKYLNSRRSPRDISSFPLMSWHLIHTILLFSDTFYISSHLSINITLQVTHQLNYTHHTSHTIPQL